MREVDHVLARAYAARASAGGPHFAVASPGRTDAHRLGHALRWPETVLALEKRHGERFEAFADSLLAARDETPFRRLLFASAHRAEGRTTLVLNLARVLARRPGRTLLVDGDLVGPMLARSLGLRPRLGAGRRGRAGPPAVRGGDGSSRRQPRDPPDRRPRRRVPREFAASAGWIRMMEAVSVEFDLALIDGGGLVQRPERRGPALGRRRGGPRPPQGPDLRARPGPAPARRSTRPMSPLLGIAETFC